MRMFVRVMPWIKDRTFLKRWKFLLRDQSIIWYRTKFELNIAYDYGKTQSNTPYTELSLLESYQTALNVKEK